ncbi:MAG: ABC transporter substrate-binding protein [Halopenitus sp.]
MTQSTGVNRRDVLKSAAAAGAVGLSGLAGCTEGSSGGSSEYPSLGNYPIEGDTATFGFNVPTSGPYSSEGEDELRGYKLAVKHLNNGGGWVDDFGDLSGDGVLDYQIDFVTGDTATDADTARESASRMISRDNVIMFSGGSSSAVAIAQQGLAQEESVMFMCCLTHSNDTTGKDCVRYSFREMFNAYMTGQALAPVVTEEYGDDLSFYQLYADYSWGQTVQESMKQFFEEAGWSEVDSVPTPLGTSDYSSYLSEAANSGADVLFLDHYGLDGANSVSQAIEAGIDEEMEIVLPLYNRPMAQAAGGAIEGIFGTIAWDSQIDNEPSNTFTEAFGSEYDGRVPSGPAQLAYAQTLQYAAATERAGTFYPPEVIRELEGYEYDNIGMGKETMRACDHQAQRAIPVVQGLSESEQGEGQFFEIVNITGRDQVGYGCDAGPAAKCELGKYGDE